MGVLAQRGVDATTQFGVEMFTFILLGGELGALSAISTGAALTNERVRPLRCPPLQHCDS